MPTENWKEVLGKALRSARGVETQSAISIRSGISDRTISLMERGQLLKKPRDTTVIRLAVATGRDPKEWLRIIERELSPDVLATQELVAKQSRFLLGPTPEQLYERAKREVVAAAKEIIAEMQHETTLIVAVEVGKFVGRIDSQLDRLEESIESLSKKLGEAEAFSPS